MWVDVHDSMPCGGLMFNVRGWGGERLKNYCIPPLRMVATIFSASFVAGLAVGLAICFFKSGVTR
jgi:hypothetical protein